MKRKSLHASSRRRLWALTAVGSLVGILMLLTITTVLAATPRAIVLQANSIDLSLVIDSAVLSSTPGENGAGFAGAAEAGAAILGGERDWQVTAAGLRFEWDGQEGDPTALDHTGLGGVDLTGGGLRDQFSLAVLGAATPVNAVLTVYEDAAASASYAFTINGAGEYVIPFSALTGSASLTDVGSLVLELEGDVAALKLGALTAASRLGLLHTQTLAVDVNNNGAADPQDVVAHELRLTNGSPQVSAPIALIQSVNGRTWQLVAGSVNTSQGTVNAAPAGVVSVNLGVIAAGGTATVDYRARYRNAGTVMADLILQDGDTPAGGSGPITSVNSPFTNGNGQVGFTGGMDGGGTTDNFVWFDTGLIFLDTSALPTVLSGGESTMGIGDSAEFLYSPSIDGNDGVWSQNGTVFVEGWQVPGLPANTNSTFNSRPEMTPNGTGYWVGGFDDTGGTTTLARALLTSPGVISTTVAVVLKSDDLVGGIPIDRPSGIDFDYQISDDNSHHIHVLLLDTGSTTDDGIVYLDGAILARETFATGAGDNWDNFDTVSVDDAGNYIFAGDTDGATGSDEFIYYNGAFAVREGDVLDGVTLTAGAFVSALSMNNVGNAAFIWSAGGVENLFVSCDTSSLAATTSLLLATNDAVDVTGDGTPDATVTDFNASTTIGPGLHLAEDGYVFVEVDLDYGNGDLEAILRLPTGCIQTVTISLDKTVGLDPNSCSTLDSIEVIGTTDVTYCYTMQNTGTVTVTNHTLVDDQLGTLLLNLPLAVGPGASVWVTETATISVTTVNSATWTVEELIPQFGVTTASASDTATVTVLGQGIDLVKTVGTVPSTCAASDTINVVAGTQVTYCYAVTNTGDFTYTNHTLVDDQLGTLFTDMPVNLAPGQTYEFYYDVVVNATVTNTATWTATLDLTFPAAATDTATVNVFPPPTSVSLTDLTGSSGYRWLFAGLAGLGALLLLGLAARRRRRAY